MATAESLAISPVNVDTERVRAGSLIKRVFVREFFPIAIRKFRSGFRRPYYRTVRSWRTEKSRERMALSRARA